MKKYRIFVLLASMFICAAAIVSSLEAAEIIYLEGSVQVQRGQEDTWTAAQKGMKVDINDKIRTARRSVAEIALDDAKKNTVRIEQKALVVLNSANPGLIDKLDLSRGKVYAKVENLKSGLAFEITTPSCVAGVRGSAYSVYAEKDEDEIQAYKDSTFVQSYNADGELISDLTIPEGFKAFIERFEAAGALTQVTMREFSRFDRIADSMAAHEQGKMELRQEQERKQQEEKGKEEQKADNLKQTSDTLSQTIEEVTDIKQDEKQTQVDSTIKDTRLEDTKESSW